MSQHLVSAAERGDMSKLRQVIERGAEPNWYGKSRGITALAAAVLGGRLEVVQKLLKYGADPNLIPPPVDSAPVHHVCAAAPRENETLLEALLDSGADPNLPTRGWNLTPLMIAAGQGAAQRVRMLLAAGADPTLKSADDRTALDFARARGHRELVALLEGAGARTGESATEPAPLLWPPPSIPPGEIPEATLASFIRAMHEWELEAARLFDADAEQSFDRSLSAMRAIFEVHCTPGERPLGRNGSFNQPPEYNIDHEILIQVAREASRAILITRRPGVGWEYRYVAQRRGGRWLLDNKKVRPIGQAQWGPWSL